jgi:hypothetical protein
MWSMSGSPASFVEDVRQPLKVVLINRTVNHSYHPAEPSYNYSASYTASLFHRAFPFYWQIKQVVDHPHCLRSDLSLLTAGNCHHGMRISSDSPGKCLSISSRGSLSEYEIWRSWEDCLWFQHTLEEEYERAAREKRRRLAQGKGVKGFNGLYKKDLASSWDSLPSGPDHRSVAQDIHEHLPTLTRRGTLFRASQATIDRRQAELIAFIRALFSDDMPALIKEIRVTSVVSDFFGLWQSDFDFAEESKILTVPRKPLTNSVFSSYFFSSHSALSLPSSDTTPRNSPSNVYNKFHRSTTPRPISPTSSVEILEEPRYPRGSSRRSRSRPRSTWSDSPSESSSDTSSSSPTGPTFADNVPIVFGHNNSDQFKPLLNVLPEEQETLSKPPEPYLDRNPRPRASATERKANRSYSICGPTLQKGLLPSERLGIVLSVYTFSFSLTGCQF